MMYVLNGQQVSSQVSKVKFDLVYVIEITVCAGQLKDFFVSI